CDAEVRFADTGPRHKTERRVERVTDLLPVQRDIPAIVRIVEPESSGSVSGRVRLVARHQPEQLEREILVAPELRSGEAGVRADEGVGARSGWIAVRDDAANPRLIEHVAADAKREEVLAVEEGSRER